MSRSDKIAVAWLGCSLLNALAAAFVVAGWRGSIAAFFAISAWVCWKVGNS